MTNQRKDLFDFILKRVDQTAADNGLRNPQAFGQWFAKLYFQNIDKIDIYDGAGDGKIDIVVKIKRNRGAQYFIINSKFTESYNKLSPVAFYDEITRFWQAFKNKNNREDYLNEVVRPTLRDVYAKLFRHYDEGDAKLVFLTNCIKNEKQHKTVSKYDIECIYLDELTNYLLEHLENAMPETDTLVLSDIQNVLTPSNKETEVPTSIVFARLHDFVQYMDEDPLDLLFARNVRLWLEYTETNKEIAKTYKDKPEEFVYSNNGITILCNSHNFDPGKKELQIYNPRVVNGSQTLHSIRTVTTASHKARVMVRIIEIPYNESKSSVERNKRKEIIHNISIRSNMQNPVKKWNLVANDDFQLELSRYFWSKGYYYERRQNEWKHKSRDLKELKISRGIDIKNMSQILSCLYYNKKKTLGPVISLSSSGDIYESNTYSILRGTSPELAFLSWEVFENLKKFISSKSNESAAKGNKINSMRYHIFTLVLVIMGDRYSSVQSSIEKLAEILENKGDDFPDFLKLIISFIVTNFENKRNDYYKQTNQNLEFSTFLKNTTYYDELENYIKNDTVISRKAKEIFK